MKNFFSETLPNFVKTLIVLALTVFAVLQVAPPVVNAAHIESPIGTIYLIPALGGIFLGLLINRFINGLISLVVLAAFAFLLFQFGYEIHGYLSRFIK